MPEYPTSYDDGLPHVKCTLRGAHYLIEFPYNSEAVKVAKDALPAPKWSSNPKGWLVNPRSRGRLPEALTQIAAVFSASNDAVSAALEVHLDCLNAARPHLHILGLRATYTWPDGVYAPALNNLAYEAGLTTKMERGRAGQISDVDALLKLARAIPAEIARAEKSKAEYAEARAREAAERAEVRDQKRQNRIPVSAEAGVAPGAVIKFRGELKAVDSLGKVFVARGEDYSHSFPPHLWDTPVRYAYLREATEAELDAHQRKSDEQAAEMARLIAERNALRALRDAPLASPEDRAAITEGQVIWHDEKDAVTGYEQWVYHYNEQLYSVIYDGSDGAAWGEKNFGYNLIAKTIPATPELIDALQAGRYGCKDADPDSEGFKP